MKFASFTRTGPWIVAHRGAMAEAPENTISAFERAVSHDTDGIELDVQLTRDGIPVICHDRTLERITGEKTVLSSLSYSRLQELDFGDWFSHEFSGETIPTLESVLLRYARQTALMIEIKSVSNRRRALEVKEQVAQTVIDLIRRCVPAARLPEIFILSFDPDILEMAFSVAPDLQYVQNLKAPFQSLSVLEKIAGMRSAFTLPMDRLDAAFIRRVHDMGKRFMTYPCNTPDEVDAALALDIDVVMSNDPAQTVSYFRSIRPGRDS